VTYVIHNTPESTTNAICADALTVTVPAQLLHDPDAVDGFARGVVDV
jgi:hypothetical protein